VGRNIAKKVVARLDAVGEAEPTTCGIGLHRLMLGVVNDTL
jgi:hypothetical protein